MKKLISSIFTLLVLSLLIAACSGDSYGKRLDKEKKAIKNFIADNGIKVIREYPADHKFAENEYYLEGSTGVYLRVVDPGDYKNALGKEEILDVTLWFDSVRLLVSSDTSVWGNRGNDIKFTYGMPGTYIESQTQGTVKYYYMSPACVLPLTEKVGVGSGAIVDLIVPFVNGSAYQRSAYEPFKFTRIHYTYYRQATEGEPSEKE